MPDHDVMRFFGLRQWESSTLALDKIPTFLTDEEFANMMQEFESAGRWMAERLALKTRDFERCRSEAARAATSQLAAHNRQAVDDNSSLAQPYAQPVK